MIYFQVDADKAGLAELYENLEKVIIDLKSYTPYSIPFINRVSRREVPDYYDGTSQQSCYYLFLVIKDPMDLNTMLRKLKAFAYTSKADFQSDLDLIYDNCHTYNTAETSPYRANVRELKERWMVLMKMIPERVNADELVEHFAGGDARSELSREKSFIPRRHSKRMSMTFLHPEFEAFCNSLPDPRYYKFRVPKLHTWSLHPLLVTNIKHIQSVQQGQSSDMNDNAWQIPRILPDKLVRKVTDRTFALVAANAGVKVISKAVVAIWRDALKRYLMDWIMQPLKRLIDEHCLSLGLEVGNFILQLMS